ncbi:Na+/H+ antiporter NhaC family protein [Staphylococcus massiliensis]|uniref:Na+ H+ antiporter n=1 Tax=Staphylococcus massiliensis S46 TaxID=1229783 RepID=K9ANR1_9STAP|nr:Na+/H+ antiporter NhaC family protein [Staphylococcus massiliensis]EKU49028.1 Na+ H+ antiporter [Staphylococcus massiliensis S46]MCG3399471.1 Na+/H+ antiporter NhaC family protein [Staphylococcus massiliensis]MCG3402429.1 Na+/H+ antiporter NhaC family protein [Staphylococcus massiliensis]MCG3411607.1 Na+/H+ antiporter NhaC family protein [Staphylococcus massiliensis]PNZ99503.1 sodium:proton antiporter [Staphylococcus massiliensis CCUG 55927]
MSNELRSKKQYGALALLPLVIFLVLYIGVGLFFTIMGSEDAFDKLPRYVAIFIGIAIAWLCYDIKTPFTKKVKVFTENAGNSGIVQLGLILLLAGAFSTAAGEMGGKDAMVNMGLSVIPASLIIPGIFIISGFAALTLGTSTGAQAAFIPVGVSVAQAADLNVAAAGAAVIAGAYFGDNLSIISDTTIAATNGVGAKMKDKFRMNFLIALPAAIITFIIYAVVGGTGNIKGDLSFNFLDVLPYLFVLVAAVFGLDVILVLMIGIVMTGIIGIAEGKLDFFQWTSALGKGMESMFPIFLVAFLVSGLVALIRYYGGIDWVIKTMKSKARNRKSAEYVISFMAGILSASLVHNVLAIIISAPIAKEIGQEYKVPPKRMASLLDIFAASALMLLPHDSGMLMVEQYGKVSYLEVLQYSFYPLVLMICAIITIQFGLLRKKENK